MKTVSFHKWLLKLIFLLLMLCRATTGMAQGYAPIVRSVHDAKGFPMINKNVSLRITARDSLKGAVLFIERFNLKTNDYGQLTFSIGNGTLISGSHDVYNHYSGIFSEEVEIDKEGGENYSTWFVLRY